MGKTIAEHARDVLIETDNFGVRYGDSGLLDKIADRYGYARRKEMKIKSRWQFQKSVHDRWSAVLTGIGRRPDLFLRRRGDRNERVFWLCECIVNGTPETPSKLGLKTERENG